ncbi:MAG TPA: plastocyanin/azurin family copper-binding protein [Xanthomonadales bacterium]|nr:plastocyanin/azurin family copper-binding protein [Xanthomonadales bacterium]
MRALLLLFASSLAAAPLGAATIDVQVRNFRFVPNDVTINVGDTVRWTNVDGVHNVVADDNSFRNNVGSEGWVFSRTFNAAGTVRYYCEVHSAPGLDINNAMNGRIRVTAPQATFAINRGIAGAWFNPPTSGQGFLIDVEPTTQFMFLAWFTYEREGATTADAKLGATEHRWLSAQGNYTGDTATLQLFRTAGGRFDQGGGTTTTNVGTLTLRFTSCTAGTATYAITTDGGLTGTIPIQRVIPGTETDCTARQ